MESKMTGTGGVGGAVEGLSKQGKNKAAHKGEKKKRFKLRWVYAEP